VIEFPAGRDLEREELRRVVGSLSARHDLWQRHVRHDAGQRVFEHLFGDAHISLWLVCWMDGHDTGFHDHDVSSGAVTVISGEVVESRLLLGAPPRGRRFRAGETFDFGASDIHRVEHAGAEPAVTIHAYSPPLRGMGSYAWEPEGALQRISLPYQQELKPLAPAA
jgi:predicted metal-dependent enzyme (double-stranded beta helix superfamily)